MCVCMPKLFRHGKLAARTYYGMAAVVGTTLRKVGALWKTRTVYHNAIQHLIYGTSMGSTLNTKHPAHTNQKPELNMARTFILSTILVSRNSV